MTSSNEVFLRIEGAGANYSVGTSDGPTFHGVTAPLPAGDLGGTNWIYLVGTYDGANWRLYRNGVQLASAADPVGALAVTGAEWAIGSTGDGWGDLFAGSIDEVAVYDKALSAAQILAHYNAATSSPAITLSIERSGNSYLINYSGGILESSSVITGQFNPVQGANSPYVIPAGFVSLIAATRHRLALAGVPK